MRIAISSKSGCGNTTVSTILAKKLGYKIINFTYRQMAEEKGMDFWDFCALAEKDDSIDKELDRRQVEMAMKEENCILASRLAIWMLESADLKVFLTARPEERAKRIQKREGGEYLDKYNETVNRDTLDSARYKRIYNIDNNRAEDVADFVLDTTSLSINEVVDEILKRVSLVENKN